MNHQPSISKSQQLAVDVLQLYRDNRRRSLNANLLSWRSAVRRMFQSTRDREMVRLLTVEVDLVSTIRQELKQRMRLACATPADRSETAAALKGLTLRAKNSADVMNTLAGILAIAAACSTVIIGLQTGLDSYHTTFPIVAMAFAIVLNLFKHDMLAWAVDLEECYEIVHRP